MGLVKYRLGCGWIAVKLLSESLGHLADDRRELIKAGVANFSMALGGTPQAMAAVCSIVVASR